MEDQNSSFFFLLLPQALMWLSVAFELISRDKAECVCACACLRETDRQALSKDRLMEMCEWVRQMNHKAGGNLNPKRLVPSILQVRKRRNDLPQTNHIYLEKYQSPGLLTPVLWVLAQERLSRRGKPTPPKGGKLNELVELGHFNGPQT